MTTETERWGLGSVGHADEPRTVIARGEDVYDLERALRSAKVAVGPGETTVLAILRTWDAWAPRLQEAVAGLDQVQPLADGEVSWLPPVVYPGKLLCVGANYNAHNREMGLDLRQTRPFVFLKPPTTSLVAHEGEISAPSQVDWLDWEGELGIVIGKTLRYGQGPDVIDAIAGYTCLNDVSARDWADDLLPGLGQDWFMHKAFDGFTPLGPVITPAWFVEDPQDLRIEVRVNGAVKQAASTGDMVFSIIEILEHLSAVATLQPGDIVATGSPPGVGFGRDPREHLLPGDEVIVRIEGLSELRNVVGTTAPAPTGAG